MSSLRARLVRFWMARFLKPKLNRSTSAEELRRISNRLTRLGRRPSGVAIDELTVCGCSAEWHTPRELRPEHVILYLHGGGYNFGSTASYRELGSRLALSCRARVLLPDYRLAPEHPHPAAVDDALGCYQWLLDQNIAPQQLAVAGDSAGGGLTLALLLLLKQKSLPLPAAAVCLSPWADLGCRGESYERSRDIDPMLTREVLEGCADRYAAGQDVEDSLISPVHGDLSGLPPLFIQVGADEILFSDSERVFEAARAAGVDVQFVVLEDLWHVVHLFATAVPEARLAIAGIGNYLSRVWNGN